MARRAQQGAVARCPWCDATLPQIAAECPECRFPLTMAAAEGGLRAPEHSVTSSTATPGGHGSRPLMAGGHAHLGSAEGPRRLGPRIRVIAWLLGLLSIVLLLAGVGTLVSASSPDARSDRLATASLLTALRQVTVGPSQAPGIGIISLRGDEPSDQATRVSVDQASGYWFGTARSSSGRCFLLAARLPDGVPVGRGTLGGSEPCTAAQVRSHLEAKLAKADRP